jgi:Cell wall-associated hydrolases (invasion-associated proteins)
MTDLVYDDLVGTPYARGAAGPQEFDCYGLVKECANRTGIYVPDHQQLASYAAIAALIDEKRPLWEEVPEQPNTVALIRIKHLIDGKVVTLNSHVGWVLPHGRMIHAWEQSGGVVVEKLDPVWTRRIVGFYRFPQP